MKTQDFLNFFGDMVAKYIASGAQVVETRNSDGSVYVAMKFMVDGNIHHLKVERYYRHRLADEETMDTYHMRADRIAVMVYVYDSFDDAYWGRNPKQVLAPMEGFSMDSYECDYWMTREEAIEAVNKRRDRRIASAGNVITKPIPDNKRAYFTRLAKRYHKVPQNQIRSGKLNGYRLQEGVLVIFQQDMGLVGRVVL